MPEFFQVSHFFLNIQSKQQDPLGPNQICGMNLAQGPQQVASVTHTCPGRSETGHPKVLIERGCGCRRKIICYILWVQQNPLLDVSQFPIPSLSVICLQDSAPIFYPYHIPLLGVIISNNTCHSVHGGTYASLNKSKS